MPRVSIRPENKDFDVSAGEVIFEALDNQGHELPHGCLAGSCGACRIEVIAGAENLKEMGEVEANTVEALRQNYRRMYGPDALKDKVIRLSCRAKILQGEVIIEPLK